MAAQTTEFVNRTIPENDERLLRQMLGLKPNVFLPTSIVDGYWRFKGFADRIGITTLSGEGLAAICFLSELRVPGAMGNDFAKAFKQGRVKVGADVIVYWRNQYKYAKLMSVNANGTATVTLEGDPAEHQVPLTEVQEISAQAVRT